MEKKQLLSKPNAPRVELKPVEHTINRNDYLRDKKEKFSGVRTSEQNTAKLNLLTKIKKHSSVNDLITVLIEMYTVTELSEEEKQTFNLMYKYMK